MKGFFGNFFGGEKQSVEVSSEQMEQATALLIKYAQNSEKNLSGIELELQSGADPYYKDETGFSAFDYAEIKGNFEAMAKMLEIVPNEQFRQETEAKLKQIYENNKDGDLKAFDEAVKQAEKFYPDIIDYANKLDEVRVVQASLELQLEHSRGDFANFNKAVVGLEEEGVEGIKQYADKLMVNRFKKDVVELKYDSNDYYKKNPGVLVFEELEAKLGEGKANNLREAKPLEIASSKDIEDYQPSDDETKKIFDLKSNADYEFRRDKYPNLSNKEFLKQELELKPQEIFHIAHPNKVAETVINEVIGQENLEAFKAAQNQRILMDSEITEAIEEEKKQEQIKAFSSFIAKGPSFNNGFEPGSAGAEVLDFALNNIHSNPQLLNQLIDHVNDFPELKSKLATKLIEESNEKTSSPAIAVSLDLAIRRMTKRSPKDYKIGELSDDQFEDLQKIAALTSNTERNLSGDFSLADMQALHESSAKIGLENLPKEMRGPINGTLVVSAQNHFNKHKNGPDAVKAINHLVEMAKYSPVVLSTFIEPSEKLKEGATLSDLQKTLSSYPESPSLSAIYDLESNPSKEQIDQVNNFLKQEDLKKLKSSLSLEAANSIIRSTDLSPEEKFQKEQESHKVDFESEEVLRKHAVEDIKRKIENGEIVDEAVKKGIDLEPVTIKKRKEVFEKEQSEREEAFKVGREDDKSKEKLQEYHQFLMQNPSLGNDLTDPSSLGFHAIKIALKNRERNPELIEQVTLLVIEQHGKEGLDYLNQQIAKNSIETRLEEFVKQNERTNLVRFNENLEIMISENLDSKKHIAEKLFNNNSMSDIDSKNFSQLITHFQASDEYIQEHKEFIPKLMEHICREGKPPAECVNDLKTHLEGAKSTVSSISGDEEKKLENCFAKIQSYVNPEKKKMLFTKLNAAIRGKSVDDYLDGKISKYVDVMNDVLKQEAVSKSIKLDPHAMRDALINSGKGATFNASLPAFEKMNQKGRGA